MTKIIKNKIVYEKNINEINGKAITIVFPENAQEIKNLIKLGNEDIIARGNGTSFTGACIPKNSVIIDFSKMNRLIEVNTAKKTAIVEPGILLSDLNEELKKYNLEFPINPLFAGIETLGGIIAKNSSGNNEIRYGRAMNWVESLDVINGKGEEMKIAHSDLSDFVGLEGTTGIIIQATLRLTNKKPKSLTILRANTLQDVFIANRKLRLKQDIVSIDLINPIISHLLGLEKKYHIFAEMDSLEGTFKNNDYEKFIKIKNKAYKKTATEGFVYMTNAKFLIDSLQDYLLYLEEKNIPYFAHLASGVVFPLFKSEETQKMEEATKFAKKLRGKLAYNFGVGLTKKDSLEFGEIELIKRAKKRHDPNCRLNKDKLIDCSILNKIEIEKNLEKGEINYEKKSEQANLERSETTTLKREEVELTPEEKDKIKKLASGFFSGGK
jgi:FAD/FMN-containing dehydrogenase